MLFLDEPTTGLDPRSRLDLWETIEDLVAEGTTVLLTTQYLDEADRLADRIAVIDRGRVIADGTADELKDRVGGERVEVHARRRRRRRPTAAAALAAMADEPPQIDGDARARDRSARAQRRDHGGGPPARRRRRRASRTSRVRRPTLDDVFLALTGHAAATRRTRRRRAEEVAA